MAQAIDDLLARFPAEPIPTDVIDLVTSFESDDDRANFKEQYVRTQFLNPLLRSMGWDLSNKDKTYAEREVIQEDSVKIGGHDKAPDYAFLHRKAPWRRRARVVDRPSAL